MNARARFTPHGLLFFHFKKKQLNAMEYNEIKSGPTPLRCFEFGGEFPGIMYLDFNTIDAMDMIETTCIISTPEGRFSSILKLSTHLFNDNEAIAIEYLATTCIEQYKKAIASKRL